MTPTCISVVLLQPKRGMKRRSLNCRSSDLLEILEAMYPKNFKNLNSLRPRNFTWILHMMIRKRQCPSKYACFESIYVKEIRDASCVLTTRKFVALHWRDFTVDSDGSGNLPATNR